MEGKQEYDVLSKAFKERNADFYMNYQLVLEKDNKTKLYFYGKFIGVLSAKMVEDRLTITLSKKESYTEIYRKYVGFSIQEELTHVIDFFVVALKDRDLFLRAHASWFAWETKAHLIESDITDGDGNNISYTKVVLPIQFWDSQAKEKQNQNILNLIGAEWYVLCYNLFTKDPEFNRVLSLYSTESQTKTLYPQKTELFAFLKNVAPSDLSVLILSEEPYSSEGEATGVPYECLKRETPALRTIKAALKEDGYEFTEDSFKSWQSQGVMFANRNLFVEKDNPKSYSGDNTSILVKKIINNFLSIVKRPLVIGAFGRKNNAFAEEIISHVKNDFLIKKVHIGVKPGDHNFADSEFPTKINSLLKKQINW